MNGRAPEAAQGRLLHALTRMPADEVRKIRKAVDRLVHVMEASDVEARFFFSTERAPSATRPSGVDGIAYISADAAAWKAASCERREVRTRDRARARP